MPSDDERREIAARLRNAAEQTKKDAKIVDNPMTAEFIAAAVFYDSPYVQGLFARLADLIEPSYKPDPEYEAWYDGLSHPGDGRGGPATIRELIEEIVWTALTVDLGPNGNTDQSTWIDEGDAYTGKLFDYWEREVLRLTGGCDRNALLTLAFGLENNADNIIIAARNAQFTGRGPRMEEAEHDAYEWHQIACCIREALGVEQ